MVTLFPHRFLAVLSGEKFFKIEIAGRKYKTGGKWDRNSWRRSGGGKRGNAVGNTVKSQGLTGLSCWETASPYRWPWGFLTPCGKPPGASAFLSADEQRPPSSHFFQCPRPADPQLAPWDGSQLQSGSVSSYSLSFLPCIFVTGPLPVHVPSSPLHAQAPPTRGPCPCHSLLPPWRALGFWLSGAGDRLRVLSTPEPYLSLVCLGTSVLSQKSHSTNSLLGFLKEVGRTGGFSLYSSFTDVGLQSSGRGPWLQTTPCSPLNADSSPRQLLGADAQGLREGPWRASPLTPHLGGLVTARSGSWRQ